MPKKKEDTTTTTDVTGGHNEDPAVRPRRTISKEVIPESSSSSSSGGKSGSPPSRGGNAGGVKDGSPSSRKGSFSTSTEGLNAAASAVVGNGIPQKGTAPVVALPGTTGLSDSPSTPPYWGPASTATTVVTGSAAGAVNGNNLNGMGQPNAPNSFDSASGGQFIKEEYSLTAAATATTEMENTTGKRKMPPEFNQSDPAGSKLAPSSAAPQPEPQMMMNQNSQSSSIAASTATMSASSSSSSASSLPNPHPLNSLSSGTTPVNTNPGGAATSRPANHQYNSSNSSSKQQTVSMGAQQASAQPSTGQYKPAPGTTAPRSSGATPPPLPTHSFSCPPSSYSLFFPLTRIYSLKSGTLTSLMCLINTPTYTSYILK